MGRGVVGSLGASNADVPPGIDVQCTMQSSSSPQRRISQSARGLALRTGSEHDIASWLQPWASVRVEAGVILHQMCSTRGASRLRRQTTLPRSNDRATTPAYDVEVL